MTANQHNLKTWEIQVRKGLIEFMTLHLVDSKEGHGYEIVQRIRIIPSFDVSESAIYPILAKFREQGELTVKSITSTSGPSKNVYQITPLGKTKLRAMRIYLQALSGSIATAAK